MSVPNVPKSWFSSTVESRTKTRAHSTLNVGKFYLKRAHVFLKSSGRKKSDKGGQTANIPYLYLDRLPDFQYLYIDKTHNILRIYDKRTDTAAGPDIPPAHLQEERTGHDVFPRRVEGRGIAQLPPLDKAMPSHAEGTPRHRLRQEPPVPAQGGGGGDSEASGGTVLEGSFGCFFRQRPEIC